MAIGANKEIVPVNTIVMLQITLENKQTKPQPQIKQTKQTNKSNMENQMLLWVKPMSGMDNRRKQLFH